MGLQGRLDEALAQEIYQLVIQIFQHEKKINSLISVVALKNTDVNLNLTDEKNKKL